MDLKICSMCKIEKLKESFSKKEALVKNVEHLYLRMITKRKG